MQIDRSLLDQPEFQEALQELESDMLTGMHPFCSSPLHPYTPLYESVIMPRIQTPLGGLSITTPSIIQSALIQSGLLHGEDSGMFKPSKTQSFLATFWVAVHVFFHAMYAGWTFLFATIPFMLRFVLAKVGMLPFFMFMVWKEYKLMNKYDIQKMKECFGKNKVNMCVTIFCYTISAMCFVFPTKYTTVAQSILFSSCSSMCIVIWKLVTRQRTPWLAILGTFIGLGGASLTILEGESGNQQRLTTGSIIFGNSLAFLGAALRAVFSIKTSDYMKQQFPHALYSFICTFACVIVGIPISFLLEWNEYQNIQWSYDLIWISIFVGFNGFISFYAIIKSLELVSPLFITTATLSQFIIAGLHAWILGVNSFPGIWIWIGGAVTVAGLFAIIKSEQKQTQARIDEFDRTATMISTRYTKMKDD